MDHLLEIVLGNTAIASLLVMLAVAARMMSSRPAVHHALWLLVLLKLLTPPVLTLPMPFLRSPSPRPAEGPAPAVAAAPARDSSNIVSKREPLSGSAHAGVAHAVEPRPEPAPAAPAAVLPRSRDVARASHAQVAMRWPLAIMAIWLGGSVLCAAIIADRLRRFAGLLRYARAADRFVQFQANGAAHRLGLRCSPRVWFVPGAVCPMLVAVGARARLLIPHALWQRLEHRQRGTLLLHELAHLRRRDHWVRIVEILTCVIYWWHPLAWLARRQLRRAEEQCCDAWVLWAQPGSGADYAEALLEAIEVSSGPGRLPALASGMGDFRDLRRRLTLIQEGTSRKALGWTGLVLTGAIAALALPLAPILAQASVAKSAGAPAIARAVPQEHPLPDLAGEATNPLVGETADVKDFARARPALERNPADLAQQLAEAQNQARELADALNAAERRLAKLESADTDVATRPRERPDRAQRLAQAERHLTQILQEIRALKAEYGTETAAPPAAK